jgi:hypothetical protein
MKGEVMQTRKLHQTARGSLAPATPRRYRGMVLLVAGTLALALATIGTVATLGGGSSSTAQAHEPGIKVVRPSTITAPNSTGTSMGLSATSSAARPLLADGTYPTYIRGVDVHSATINVDVIQVFQDEAAAKAAIEDGKAPSEAQGLYIYIRNQNSLLRILPVAADVGIHFLGTCEESPDRNEALTELAKKTTPFTKAYYWDVRVRDGAINDITQRQAIPAC